MIKLISIATLIVTISIIPSSTFCQTKSHPLVGTWRLVSAKMTSNQQTSSRDSSTIHQVKVVTPSTMMFTIYKTDTLRLSAQGKITVKGNQYSETITEASNKPMVGRTFNYKYTLLGNRWHIDGGVDSVRFVEDWVRVD